MAYIQYDLHRIDGTLLGLSTETKPTLAVYQAGSALVETDTGRVFRWTGTKWIANQPVTDELTGGQIVISEPHALIHEGKVFHMTQKITGILNGSSVDFLLRVPVLTFPHVHKMRANTGAGDIDIVAYEGSTITAPGTPLPAFDINRVSDNTPSMTLFAAPTVSALGTEVHRLWLPPTTQGQGNTQEGISDAEAGEEWILKPNTDYVQRLTNNSGSTISAWVELLWYEI